MPDPRHEKFAQVVVRYSLAVKPGDKVIIQASELAAPVIRELYREILRAGGHPATRISIDGLGQIFYSEANDDQLTFVSELDKLEIEHFDALVGIQASYNTKSLSHVDPQKLAKSQAAHAVISKRFMERSAEKTLRWCATLFPTNALAQDAGMSLHEYEDFVFGTMLLDSDDPVAEWRKVQAEQQHIVDYLNQHDEIHIVAPGTDVTYRVGGRTWINAAGDYNMPDGEVFTGPIEDSVNGTVHFSYPAVYHANEVEDVTLTFEHGRVVDATARRGLEFLISMLDSDAGARSLGEVAFGLNYGVKNFSKNALFDEKIGGTMHMALGESYPETGGVNESGLHWDIVCDLREGQVFADGTLCYEAGKFII
ncbi:MAG: aminopeptidase [Chloroflexota bacterium]